MTRRIIIIGLLACTGFLPSLEARGAKRYLKKESTVDMSAMKSVFVGWVDMEPADWGVHGYGSKEEWVSDINSLNAAFHRLCETIWLHGRTVVAAKEKGDENVAAHDLYIKFSGVRVDYDNYYLHLAVHFVDPKTSKEIAAVPLRPYYGNDWGFVKYLRAALDEVGRKVEVEVTGSLINDKK